MKVVLSWSSMATVILNILLESSGIYILLLFPILGPRKVMKNDFFAITFSFCSQIENYCNKGKGRKEDEEKT